MGSRFVDTLAELVRAAGGTTAPDFQEQVQRTMDTARLGTGEFIPAYFIDMLGRMARGEPTEGWVNISAEDVGLSFVLDDLAAFVPEATFRDELTWGVFYVPRRRMKTVIEYAPGTTSRYSVMPMAPDELPPRAPGAPPPAPRPIIEGGFDPDEAMVRKWAYDTNRWLTEQDEDLALHGDHFFPLLIELASDPKGPKAGYIRQILEASAASSLLQLSQRPLTPFVQARDLALQSQVPAVRDWGERFARVLEYLGRSGAPTLEEATEVARELLMGKYRVGVELVRREAGDWWEFSIGGIGVGFRGRLYVHRPTGRLVFSGMGAADADVLEPFAGASGRGPYYVGQRTMNG